MEKEQKYLQKDILRMIFQMRKCGCEEKLIKRMIITEHDLTDYRWKSSIRKLQEAGFLETDSEEKIPALTESGTTYAKQLKYAADGWNQFLQMTGVDEKTADKDGRLMACEISEEEKIDNLWRFINTGGRNTIPKSIDCHTLWKILEPGKYQVWFSFYTTEIGQERKTALEDLRFEREGWLRIEPWEIWLELIEHPDHTDEKTIWYQDTNGIWQETETDGHSIKIPATAVHMEYKQQWMDGLHCTCNLGFVAGEDAATTENTMRFLDGRLLQEIPIIG